MELRGRESYPILDREQIVTSQNHPAASRSVEGRTRTIGRDHPATGWSMIGVATALTRLGCHIEAERLFRDAKANFELPNNQDESGSQRAMLGISQALLGQGKVEESERILDEALPELIEVLGPDDPVVLQLMHDWAMGRQNVGVHDERTESVYVELLRRREAGSWSR
jgi:hypothetical protein